MPLAGGTGDGTGGGKLGDGEAAESICWWEEKCFKVCEGEVSAEKEEEEEEKGEEEDDDDDESKESRG